MPMLLGELLREFYRKLTPVIQICVVHCTHDYSDHESGKMDACSDLQANERYYRSLPEQLLFANLTEVLV